MAVGANSVRPPLFAYMVCTNSTPPQLLETGRRISAKQKLRCSPTGIRASFCAAKSLRSLRIYVLLWDRIAVQIVLLRYFFCLISYFYMLLILQSAPSRLSPNVGRATKNPNALGQKTPNPPPPLLHLTGPRNTQLCSEYLWITM